MKDYFKDFEFNEKSDYKINEVNKVKLPQDYLDFMSIHNGGEGNIGDNAYGCFYKLEELVEVNNEYAIQVDYPGYFIFGNDLGDMLFAYNDSKKIYCLIDACNMDDDTYTCIGNSLEEFIINLDKEYEEKI